MRISILGCSGGIGPGLRTTCLQVDDDILIDAGTGLGDLPLERMAGIRHIFITHSHLDHVLGIPLMVDSIFDRIREPVVVHAREETIDALRRHVFNWMIWPDFSQLPTPEQPVLRFEVMHPGDVVEVHGRRVEMIAVNHVVPGAGYAVEAGGRHFAFSGDTTTNDTFWEALNRRPGLDALVVEAAFGDRDLELCRKAYHYCPQLLAEDLAKLRHRPAVYLSHLKPGAEDCIYARCRELIRDFSLTRLCGGETIKL